MSDTVFTAPPHWQWLVILYFFFGGLAGGSYALGTLLRLAGDGIAETLQPNFNCPKARCAIIYPKPSASWARGQPDRSCPRGAY